VSSRLYLLPTSAVQLLALSSNWHLCCMVTSIYWGVARKVQTHRCRLNHSLRHDLPSLTTEVLVSLRMPHNTLLLPFMDLIPPISDRTMCAASNCVSSRHEPFQCVPCPPSVRLPSPHPPPPHRPPSSQMLAGRIPARIPAHRMMKRLSLTIKVDLVVE
jgi:hypothetical protein